MAEYEAKIDLGITGLGPAEHIGRGGFADVYKAEQMSLRRTVAVKVLRAQASDESSESRFERECHALGAVSDHPHIVGVHEGGFTRNGRAYLVMEYLPGGSLLERVQRNGPIPAAEAIDIGIKIGKALAVAHDAGVLHRDVKPANIMISAYGEPALGDFGIARIEGGPQTATGLVTASFAHAAPEVLEGHPPTTQADIYSLGSTLFELLTGNAPYYSAHDESIWPLMKRILSEPMPDPLTIGMSPSFAQVYNKMTSRDLVDRYLDAQQVVRDLSGLADDPDSLRLNPIAITADLRDINSTVVASPPEDGPTATAERPADGAPAGTGMQGLAQVPPPTPKPDLTSLRRSDTDILPTAGSAPVGTSNSIAPPGYGGSNAPTMAAGVPANPNAYAPAGYGPPDRIERRRRRPLLTALLALLAIGAAAGGVLWYLNNQASDTDAANGVDFVFAEAASGPLVAFEPHKVEVRGVRVGSSFRYLVDGQPTGDFTTEFLDFRPPEGRHEVAMEIMEESGGTFLTTAVPFYAVGRLPAAGFRANLSSVSHIDGDGVRNDQEQWSHALEVFDTLVSEGHGSLMLVDSNDYPNELPNFWNLYVPGFVDENAANQYCTDAGLQVPDQCFADFFDPASTAAG